MRQILTDDDITGLLDAAYCSSCTNVELMREVEALVISRISNPIAITAGGKTYFDVEFVEGAPDLGDGVQLYAVTFLQETT